LSAGGGLGGGREGFRPATPNTRGQYSSAVLDELESQNDEQVGVLTGKVKMLKDVCTPEDELLPPSVPWTQTTRVQDRTLGECLRTLKSMPLLTETAAHAPHRGRDPRLLETGRLNERLLRKQPAETQRNHESNVEDGGEDWGRVEGMAGLLCGGYTSVLVCEAVLRAGYRIRRSMSKARTRVLYKVGLAEKESGVWGSKLAGATRALGLDFF
jgi:hypothetical protein